MEIFRYIGKNHNAFCNWQGHSNGRLRIKGRHKDKDIEFVFSVSCYKFYFYIVRVKQGVPFRSLMIHGLNPIFFVSKTKRNLYFLQQRINIMTSVQQILSRLASANHRRKRAEKTLKRVRKESRASVEHWKNATVEWQRIAHIYAMKYAATLDTNKDKDTEEALEISARFLDLNTRRSMYACNPPRCSPHTPQAMYDGLMSQIVGKKKQEEDVQSVCEKLRILNNMYFRGQSVFIHRYDTEIECLINSMTVSPSTRLDEAPEYSIDLVNIKDDRTHYGIESINEIIIK